MHISHEDLMKYLHNFKDVQRENVYKAILDSNMLEEALSNPDGKLILNNTIDIITTNVIDIVTICAEETEDISTNKIYPKCLEINLAYKLLVNWATILTDGNKHKQKIGAKK